MPAASIFLPAAPGAYDAALEGLTGLSEFVMSQGGIPPLYSSGARYQTERDEEWRHAGLVCGEGWGDCEDLACYRAAELRVSGEDPGAWAHTYVSGPHRLHAVVCRGDGSIEDPSLVLGMQPHDPNCCVVDDPLGGLDQVTFHPDVSGGLPMIRVPLHPSPGIHKAMMIRPPAPHFGRGRVSHADVAGFWGQAFRVTKAVLSTPEARSLLPPGAALALARSSQIASAARRVANAAQRAAEGPRQPPPPVLPDEYIPPAADEAPPMEDQSQ